MEDLLNKKSSHQTMYPGPSRNAWISQESMQFHRKNIGTKKIPTFHTTPSVGWQSRRMKKEKRMGWRRGHFILIDYFLFCAPSCIMCGDRVWVQWRCCMCGIVIIWLMSFAICQWILHLVFPLWVALLDFVLMLDVVYLLVFACWHSVYFSFGVIPCKLWNLDLLSLGIIWNLAPYICRYFEVMHPLFWMCNFVLLIILLSFFLL